MNTGSDETDGGQEKRDGLLMQIRSEYLHDPTSAAYKKARRKYLKTTRNRANNADPDWTPFRAAEKKYKARFPPPDLSDVLDIAWVEAAWKGRPDAVQYKKIALKGVAEGRKAYVFPSTPGLVLLPSFISPDEQRDLVWWALCDQARCPNETNLDTHYVLPEEGLWNKFLQVRSSACDDEVVLPRALADPSASQAVKVSEPPGPRKLVSNEAVDKHNYLTLTSAEKLPPAPSASLRPVTTSSLIPKLRWANIGWSYHWGTKQYDFTKGRGDISSKVRNICKRAVELVRWDEVVQGTNEDHIWGEESDWALWDSTYEPDAGIVNFYQTKDTLMAHVDRSEVCATSPLVSISLGCAAVFLIGGLTRDVEPIPILLRSGDVVIMSGPACRRAYHGVPRILEETLPPHLEEKEQRGQRLGTIRKISAYNPYQHQRFNPAIDSEPRKINEDS
ncbi:Alpha-ketoglutarate-dependent dioxygenase alkB, partial [Grifola frondosa]